MINTITICPDGHLIPESDCLGRTGEHNATVLKFDFFEDLNGKSASDFEKFVVALFPEGEKPYAITGNRFELPSELTVYTEIILRVDMKIGNDVIFRTEPRLFILEDSDITPSYPEIRHPLIGDINRLNTEDKKNLVNAINEVLEIARQGGSDVGFNEVFEKIPKSVNLYQPITEGWIDNTTIHADGSTEENSKFCLTAKIPVKPSTTYSVNGWDKGYFKCYDSNDNFIGSSMTQLASGDIQYAYGTTKDNTAYIRLELSKETDLETTISNFNSSFIIVEGVGINLAPYGFKTLIREIGDLSELELEDKYKKNLVSAINGMIQFSTLTDPTLTKEGVAADAKAVSDKFNELDIKLCEIIGSGVLV